MSRLNDVIGSHSMSLSLLEHRSEILMSNIVNASTPHYKAQDIDFEGTLKEYLNIGDLDVTSEDHFKDISVNTGHTQYRQPFQASFDGNTVEPAVEQVEFSQNIVRFNASWKFLDSAFKGIRRSLKGE